MSPIIKPKWKRRCAVVRCSVTDISFPRRKFYNFPSANRNREKRELWKDALCRVNKDGSPWSPKKSDVVCNDHFTTGMHSMSRYDTDYCPSIFPATATSGSEAYDVEYPPLQESQSRVKIAKKSLVDLDHGQYTCKFQYMF